uniref:thioredoxin family protein n=1 Tax=Paractinoplanes polyasparticus TaxID=2856853 RepID=UPI001C86366F|nr:thioredoxin family protein [Actinoplanes polyasparticus]
MATIAVTDDNFEEITEKGGIVVLDFWAAWCAPCKAFAPVYEAASERNPDIVFGKIDIEAADRVTAALDIRGVPTVAVYRDGIPVFFQAGALPRPELDSLVEQVRALDMDHVRAEVERHARELGHVHG